MTEISGKELSYTTLRLQNHFRRNSSNSKGFLRQMYSDFSVSERTKGHPLETNMTIQLLKDTSRLDRPNDNFFWASEVDCTYKKSIYPCHYHYYEDNGNYNYHCP